MGEMDDVVSEFLVESYENLDRLDTDLLALESNPNAREMLASIFRTIHTIKGTCGFLGFGRLEKLTHVGESLLSLLRDGKLAMNAEITTALLALVDATRRMLSNIEKQGNEGTEEFVELKQTLTRLQGEFANQPKKSLLAPGASVAAPAPSAPAAASPAPASAAPVPAPAPAVAVASTPTETTTQPSAPLPVSTDSTHGAPMATATVDAPQAPAAPAASAARPAEGAKGTDHSIADNSIRVDVNQLDKLMNLVGELVLARNQVLQFTTGSNDNGFLATTQRLNLITTELQESIMKTRMQPISNVWSKLPRVVRDLAQALGKKIKVEMDGKETELDKTILEAIKDPLTHIVRNSCDHGIETPEVRRQRGKPEEGTLQLRAFHEGGQVVIEISDDGGGVDVERVKRKAVSTGLITQEQASRMSEREACMLIFAPGLSTAAAVTNVSGRGVGMDVVRSNIEKTGGQIDLQNKFGFGLAIRIKIPLTLAIIPALVVVTGNERFAIPQVSLLELVRLEGDAARTGIEYIEDSPVYRLRGALLPLVFLDRQLGLPGPDPADDAVNIVVLQADERQFGLVVHRICDTEEIVVKPLGKLLKGLSSFAGATIMGDGRVALILDVMGLAQRARVVNQSRERSTKTSSTTSESSAGQKRRLLLFRVGSDLRMAAPLEDAARLEEFAPDQIEVSGSTRVVQYRGDILPLVSLAELFGRPVEGAMNDPTAPGCPAAQAVVVKVGERTYGLVVDRILDIVEQELTVQRKASRQGLLGTAVIGGKVTDLIDVNSVIGMFDVRYEGAALGA
ncbi:MAG: chemotaxis protein CheW [Planctomycetota bacterium]|nr:chemotaxis protein CheW [Planctomycetota bacterium]